MILGNFFFIFDDYVVCVCVVVCWFKVCFIVMDNCKLIDLMDFFLCVFKYVSFGFM